MFLQIVAQTKSHFALIRSTLFVAFFSIACQMPTAAAADEDCFVCK